MKKYRLLNNIMGWITFAIAAFTFLNTVEPTVSWWDCGEFIATSYKLEVGHPPGAPLFMLLGRFFSLFAHDSTKVALMINSLSALASAFAVLFLFWSITILAKKIFWKEGNFNAVKGIAIFGSAFVGALAFTFSDSFWFSAVEGEVYATSAFFTSVVFWAMLKWEEKSEEQHADRWIVFIGFLMGLSIGVHLLNLLAIPSLCFIYYFKKFKTTKKKNIYALLISAAILAFIQYGIIPGIPKLASRFELLFVNNMGMPFGSGIVFYAILLVALIVWGLWYTQKKKKINLNTAILFVTFILIGYSSYATIVIRSIANTPLNENNPSNVFSLLSFLNREQYGDRPLIYGPYYNAPYQRDREGRVVQVETGPIYIKGEKKYEKVGSKTRAKYDSEYCTIFPRMYGTEDKHIKAYKAWTGIRGDRKPTFAENLSFFFRYQVGFMYNRYFLWNFAGRQNDIQGHGVDDNGNRDFINGNWISGISFIDAARLGTQEKLPPDLANNKARNKFYMLPLLLGLIGVFYHIKYSKKDAWVVFLLFLLTGFAIIVYLNQTPYQPRERDYSYAGSTYAFAIWIGLGVGGLIKALEKKTPALITSIGITVLSIILVPGIMAKEGWDDHDRSKKTAARDFAINYLMSCEPNAVIITNGDNDTFPLWYAQEVEGIRTDVRVLNFTLASGDWYIQQLMRKLYDSEKLPFTLKPSQYNTATNDLILYYDKRKGAVKYRELADYIKMIAEENPAINQKIGKDAEVPFFDTKNFRITVDSAYIVKNNLVPQSMKNRIVKSIDWTIKKNYLYKNDLMLLDFIATNNWKRPVYFINPSTVSSVLDIDKYCHLEGFAYRFLPVKANNYIENVGGINADRAYDVLVNKCKWGNLANPDVYVDRDSYNMGLVSRNHFARLSNALTNLGKKDSAVKVLDFCNQVLPQEKMPHDVYSLAFVQSYYIANAFEKGNIISDHIADYYDKYLEYYYSLDKKRIQFVKSDMQQALAILQRLIQLANEFEQKKQSEKLTLLLNKYLKYEN